MSQSPNEHDVFEPVVAPIPHGYRRDQTRVRPRIVPNLARRCGQALLVFVLLLLCVETALGRGRAHLAAIFEHSARVQFLSFPPNNPNAADPVSTAMWTRIGMP